MLMFWILLALLLMVLGISYVCFRMAFLARKAPPAGPDDYPTPEGAAYDPYRPQMIQWIREVRALEHEDVSITSFDGLTLWGTYYESRPGAPLELMFHGYRGSAERDLCGGVQRAFALGRNVLLVDQRTSCRSEGRVITFGVKEARDCRSWVDFCIGHFGSDVTIILTGISMGAATVLMAAGEPLPKNVAGVLADCGYTTAREMIEKTICEMHLPPRISYPFVRLGARLFGGFDPEDARPLEAVRRSAVPTIFFHGEDDHFVPCDMSRRNYESCAAPKALMTVPGADHGLSYPADPTGYLQAVAAFFTENGVPTEVLSTNYGK